MGRLFLQDLRRTPEKPYYVCSTCQNHIGFLDDYYWHPSMSEAFRYMFKLVNVVIDGPAHYRPCQGYQSAAVHCVRCNMLLGCKLVDSATKLHMMAVAKLQVMIGDHAEPATNDLQYRQHFE